MEAAVRAVDADATLAAAEERGVLPAEGTLTTLVTRNLGGLSVAVHALEPAKLIAEGFASTLGGGAVATPGVQEVAPSAPLTAAEAETAGLDVEARHWDPESGESVEDRLRAIVSESMGYAVDDLPLELPLIDLGLDSLMGMRIKNRIENDFQIPPLQVQALRDASVADVITMVEDLVAGREPVAAAAPAAPEKTESTVTGGVGVAPRDASERMVFGTWAGITGAALAGVTTPLPHVEEEVREDVAKRLSERSGAEITAADVASAETLAELADLVREGLEDEVDGNVRVLRPRPEGSQRPAVIMFHPAGGSSVVYQPLMRRLPDDVPVYGIERREGSLEERAAAYLDDVREIAGDHPVILGGWSFGGALAYEVAHQLQGSDVDVAAIALLDTVQPANPAPDTPEETKKRWERYAASPRRPTAWTSPSRSNYSRPPAKKPCWACSPNSWPPPTPPNTASPPASWNTSAPASWTTASWTSSTSPAGPTSTCR
nr:non-ribosomal peptide synthetase [Corynebacterium renale]